MQSKEIASLLKLIDDPDEEIFTTVANKLMEFGREIIPRLEHLWESTSETDIQQRIELLIHRVNFRDLEDGFMEWCKSEQPELLQGAILISRYQYPDLNVSDLLLQFDKLRKSIWLEFNRYMTPLEQVLVLNTIIYSFQKLQGNELNIHNPKHFFINQLFESKQGNSYSIGLVYLSLCEMMDIPIFAIDVPRQFLFAYIDTVQNYMYPDSEGVQEIQFFLDPTNGLLYTHKDVDTYLNKINAKDKELYFLPINTKRIMYKLLEELVLCYQYNREEEKAEEIKQLMRIIVDSE